MGKGIQFLYKILFEIFSQANDDSIYIVAVVITLTDNCRVFIGTT